MQIQLKLLSDWRIWIGIVSGLSFLFSVFNLIVRRHIFNRLTNNDLKHLTSDVIELKSESKEIKVDLKGDLEKIFRRLGRIDKAVGVQKAICDVRHGKK